MYLLAFDADFPWPIVFGLLSTLVSIYVAVRIEQFKNVQIGNKEEIHKVHDLVNAKSEKTDTIVAALHSDVKELTKDKATLTEQVRDKTFGTGPADTPVKIEAVKVDPSVIESSKSITGT